MSDTPLRIAIVHDYLREYGGAERVVEAMHRIWPEAPVYTSFIDRKSLGRHAARFEGWDIRESWLARVPIVAKFISPLRFLAPLVWQSFDLSGYDVVLTSSGWFIPRGVIVHKPTTHVCYIHHPPRNLYGYATGSDLTKYRAVRVYAAIINFFMRRYDYRTAQRVDEFVANSVETARRVAKFYRREATVIYPPIVIPAKAEPKKGKGTYYLTVGRLAWAKRIDLIIAAANQRKLPLRVIGAGKEEEALRRIAGPTVTFLGGVSDEELDRQYAGAKALIFAALDEDFGMVPVEAMARGVPVIALAQGGVVESVVDGKTGVLFTDVTPESLSTAITRFETLSKTVSWELACRKRAAEFGEDVFRKKLVAFITDAIARRRA